MAGLSPSLVLAIAVLVLGVIILDKSPEMWPWSHVSVEFCVRDDVDIRVAKNGACVKVKLLYTHVYIVYAYTCIYKYRYIVFYCVV